MTALLRRGFIIRKINYQVLEGDKIMKHLFKLVFIGITALFLGVLFSQAEQVSDNSKNPSSLYALSGKSGSLEGDTLTINGISNVIYFSDRPERKAGHITLKQLVELWNKGSDSFKADPPNAEISIFKESGDEQNIIILSNPEVKDEAVSFKIEFVGKNQLIPNSFGHSTLFIDDMIDPAFGLRPD